MCGTELLAYADLWLLQRYRAVLDACALTPDLAEFKGGDLSKIGENGIGLSGGQRARVALARAVYSKNKILLLDDPIAALDQQTAEAIVKKLFSGPLVAGRTVVLVTHRTDLVLHVAPVCFGFVLGDLCRSGNLGLKSRQRTLRNFHVWREKRETVCPVFNLVA